MNIVARAVAPVLFLLSSLVGPGLSAQEQAPTVSATEECCPTPVGAITDGRTGQDAALTGGGQGAAQTGGRTGLDGTIVVEQALAGIDNLSDGMANGYLNKLRIFNPLDRLYSLHFDGQVSGVLVPAPGFMVFTWDPDTNCNLDCTELTDFKAYSPSGGGYAWGSPPAPGCCCCSCCAITQSGGGPGPATGGGPSPSDADFTPQGQLNPNGSNPSLPGRPLVAASNRSGAQLWWHLPNPHGTPHPDSFIEVRHWDGTVARYELKPDMVVHRFGGDQVRLGKVWQLKKTTDPYDNVTLYTYDPAGRLTRVSYPNGVYAHWNWNPSWTANWGTGHSGIEIRHSTSDLAPAWPGSAGAEDPPHEDSTFFVFKDIDGKSHFAGKLVAAIGQRSSHVAQPSAGQTYDVSAEFVGHRATQFVYGSTGAASNQILQLRTYWQSAVSGVRPPSVAITVLENTYSGRKVVAQVQPHLGPIGTSGPSGLLTSYDYTGAPTATPAGVTLVTQKVTNPDQSETITEYDPTNLRVYRTRKLPGANGRPRNAEGLGLLTGALVEPEEVVIDFTYDATCVCQKPIRVDRYVKRGGATSGMHTTRFAYDPITKWVTHVYSPNPATSGAPAEVVEVTQYAFDSAAVWSPRWIFRRTTPTSDVQFSYPHPIARAIATHGSMQGQVVETWIDVKAQTDLDTESESDVVRSIVRNIPSNPAFSGLSYSGPVSGFPRGQVRSSHADGVLETMQYDSAHGRLLVVTGGGTATGFAHDWWGRLTSIVTNVGSAVAGTWTITQDHQFRTKSEVLTGTAIETRYHYDQWGNLAVTLRKNASASGGAPARHGLGSAARPWIREERIWVDTWLQELRVDRRPVDESDASPFSSTNPLFLVTKYEFQLTPTMTRKITAPNGAVTEETFDGLGAPFRTIVRESSAGTAPVLHVSRVYLDDYLNPVSIAKGLPSSADDLRETRLHRNAAGAVTSIKEPTRSAVPGYLGVIGGAVHELDVDAGGRTTGRRLTVSATVGEWSYKLDSLGRTIRTQATVLGVGTGVHVAIAKYQAGHFATLEATKATDVAAVTRAYDGENRLSTVTDAAGNITRYTYLPGTQLVASVERALTQTISPPTPPLPALPSPTTFKTSYTYDQLGRVLTSSEGESSPLLTTTYAYTSLGHVERQTDAMGRVQKFLHDALGRMVDHVRVGDGSDFIRNTAEYVDSGLANSRTHVSQIDGNGAVTRTHFDFAGRRFLVHYPGADLSATPSVSAATPSTSSPVANTELFLYDGLSQVVKRLDGDGGVTLMVYDASGRLIQRGLEAVNDAIAVYNVADILHRDAFGRIEYAQSFAGLNGGAANGTPVIPARLMDAKTTYDSISRVHEESWEVYVNWAQVMKTKSTFGTADRFRSTMRYEDGNNAQNLDVGFGDDAVNRLTSVTWTRPGVGSGALPLAGYSWLGSMRQQRTSTYGGASPLATGVADYTYDQYGRMTQMKDDVTPNGGTKVTRNQFDYAYNPAYNLVKEEYTKVNGKAGDRFTYDAYHRIKDAYMGVDTTVMAGADPTSFNASTMTKQFSYDLDAAQNRTNVNETTAAGTEVTPYYLVGDGSNRYQYVGDARPEYDNRGNLTFDGRFYYRYDFLNRLQEVWKVIREGATAQQSAIEGGEKYMVVDSVEALDSSRKDVEEDVFQMMRRLPTEHANPTFRSRLRSPIPGGVIVVPNQASGTSSSTSGGGMPGFILPADLELVAVYGYDAYNRRVIRVVIDDYVGGAWVTTYDGWREAVEHTVVPSSPAQMVPVKQFVHGSGLDEILAYRRFNGTSWEDYHILHGGQDTAAKLVNQSGQVVEQYEYDPFGKATVYTAAGALVDVGPAGTSPEDGTRSAYGLMHLYKAMRLDPETGNCYVRNRFYDPRTGRFMSRDPIGVWGDAGNMGNEYAYAWNRPLVVGDALGLFGGSGAVGPFRPNVHDYITSAANEGNLSAEDLGKVIEANLAQDGGVGGFLGALFGSGPYADPLNHGDNNLIDETIGKIWERNARIYDIFIMINNSRIDPCSGAVDEQVLYDEALKLLGENLHAVQDLYAHSRYVEYNGGSMQTTGGGWIGSGAPPPIWDLYSDGPNGAPGVYSGAYTIVFDEICSVVGRIEGTHAAEGKDYAGHPRAKMPTKTLGPDGVKLTNFDLALDVATRHSRVMIEEFAVVRDWAFGVK